MEDEDLEDGELEAWFIKYIMYYSLVIDAFYINKQYE